MTTKLTVWPDGLWLVVDVSGPWSTCIAKGTWKRARGNVIVEADEPREPKEAKAWCLAAMAVIGAMLVREA